MILMFFMKDSRLHFTLCHLQSWQKKLGTLCQIQTKFEVITIPQYIVDLSHVARCFVQSPSINWWGGGEGRVW